MKYLVALFLLLPACVSADIFTSLNGEIVHGEKFTIRDYDEPWGWKAQAAPLKYDNFQDGTPNSDLTGWTTASKMFSLNGLTDYYPKYKDDVARFTGDVTSYQWFGQVPGESHYDYHEYGCEIIYDGFSLSENEGLYFHGYLWSTEIHPDSRNAKILALTGDGWEQNTDGRWDYYPYQEYGTSFVNSCTGSQTQDSDGYGPDDFNFGDEVWTRIEFWHYRGSVGGGNGLQRIWVDLDKKDDVIGDFMADGSCAPTELHIQGFFDATVEHGHPDPQQEASAAFRWSELYIDNTQARVEIGNAPVWDDCTHREIQIPITWKPWRIDFTVNLGTFDATEDTLWAFVVDDDGDVHGGYSLTTPATRDRDRPDRWNIFDAGD
jgi:hypothetical protein